MSHAPRKEQTAPVQLGCWGQAAIVALFLLFFFLAVP